MWLTFGSAVGAVLAVLPWVSTFGPLGGAWGGTLAAFAVTAVPGTLLASAWRRSGLPARLRQALGLLALSMLLTAGGNALRVMVALGVALPTVPGLDITSTFAIWALGLVALLRLPLEPLPRGGWWRIAADITIAGMGMALAVFVVWTLPGLRSAQPPMRSRIMLYNWMEAANLVVLSVILVRGAWRPIRRAVWWLSSTIVIETTYLVALQYAIGRQAHDLRLSNSLFFIDYAAYLFAATFFLSDPQPDPAEPFLPEIMRAVNPLPALAVLGVGGILIASVIGKPDRALAPLAVGIVCMAILLLARLIGTTWANVRLLRQETADELRREAEKLGLMRRMSGGVAHVVNNLMNVVRLNAEMVLLRVEGNRPIRDNLREIDVAAQRAAALASRLLLASGHHRSDNPRRRLVELVRDQIVAVESGLAGDRKMVWGLAEAEGAVAVDPAELKTILEELVANAAEATTPGGAITIRVRDEKLPGGLGSTYPRLRPGSYAVLAVVDDGRGIAEADVSRVVEPFFSTRPLHEGRGLGLSVALGIATSYGGGLLFERGAEGGTCVSVYLPAAEADAPASP